MEAWARELTAYDWHGRRAARMEVCSKRPVQMYLLVRRQAAFSIATDYEIRKAIWSQSVERSGWQLERGQYFRWRSISARRMAVALAGLPSYCPFCLRRPVREPDAWLVWMCDWEAIEDGRENYLCMPCTTLRFNARRAELGMSWERDRQARKELRDLIITVNRFNGVIIDAEHRGAAKKDAEAVGAVREGRDIGD